MRSAGGANSKMIERPHLDDLIGRLARIAHVVRPRVRDTRDRLTVYEGLPPGVLLPAPPSVPNVHRRRRWELAGLRSEDLWFRSQHEPLEPSFHRHYFARNRRIHTVYARRVRPEGDAPRRRLLYIHGYMQPETAIEEVALLAMMARALDMEIVQIQPPYHGRRKPRRSTFDGELYWTADLVRSMESVRQSLIDARSLLLWMQEQDTTPVGVSGLSLGGALAATLTCIEPGFDFSAPIIAHMDLGALMADAPVLAATRSDLRRFGWTPADFAAFIEGVGWNTLRPAVPPERILLFAAADDRFFRPDLVEKMWRHWGEPQIQWYPGSHMGFLANLPDTIARLRAFVDELESPKVDSPPVDGGG